MFLNCHTDHIFKIKTPKKSTALSPFLLSVVE
ncbi:hypothetical protein CF65_01531 [Aggregatibacter actinomycetemcomitans HK1651]|nr:hypothetical protein CF65_01531 [Aggregatibacter actinomycetemcomitans HK1651]